MHYLDLQSARAILETIGRHDGQLTWYSIVKDVDQRGLEKSPPSYLVLKELANNGLLRVEPPEGGNLARYWLTDTGRRYLDERVPARARADRKRSKVPGDAP